MINRGFTYCVPPFMIRSNVVTGVMSFAEMDAMMYKIEGEDLYLIGTSEHSMIGKFIDQIVPEEELPKTLSSETVTNSTFFSVSPKARQGAPTIRAPVRTI